MFLHSPTRAKRIKTARRAGVAARRRCRVTQTGAPMALMPRPSVRPAGDGCVVVPSRPPPPPSENAPRLTSNNYYYYLARAPETRPTDGPYVRAGHVWTATPAGPPAAASRPCACNSAFNEAGGRARVARKNPGAVLFLRTPTRRRNSQQGATPVNFTLKAQSNLSDKFVGKLLETVVEWTLLNTR